MAWSWTGDCILYLDVFLYASKCSLNLGLSGVSRLFEQLVEELSDLLLDFGLVLLDFLHFLVSVGGDVALVAEK